MAKMNPPVLKHDPFCQVHLLPIHSKKAMRSWVFELHSWIEMQTASCQLQSSGIRRPGTDIAAEIRTLLMPQKSWGLFQLNAYRIRGSRWISFSARPLALSAPRSMSYVLCPAFPRKKKNNFEKDAATFRGSHIIRPTCERTKGRAVETKRSASKIMKLIKKVSAGQQI